MHFICWLLIRSKRRPEQRAKEPELVLSLNELAVSKYPESPKANSHQRWVVSLGLVGYSGREESKGSIEESPNKGTSEATRDVRCTCVSKRTYWPARGAWGTHRVESLTQSKLALTIHELPGHKETGYSEERTQHWERRIGEGAGVQRHAREFESLFSWNRFDRFGPRITVWDKNRKKRNKWIKNLKKRRVRE